MKYKLINIETKEETICEKVTIDGSDYYINNEEVSEGDFGYEPNPYKRNEIIKVVKRDQELGFFRFGNVWIPFSAPNNLKKVIATSNPNINIPEVIDLVHRNYVDELDERRKIAKNFKGQVAGKHPYAYTNLEVNSMIEGYLEGYNKSQELYPFSEEDLIDFKNWCDQNESEIRLERVSDKTGLPAITTKELLQIWNEQRIKTLYYQ